MSATIAELESLLGRAKLNPKQFFGDDLDSVLRDCLGKSHPDRFQESDKARADEIFKEFQSAAESTKTPPITIKTPGRTYTIRDQFGVGDVADVNLATSGSDSYVIKVSRVPGAEKLLRHEFDVLKEIGEKAGDKSYRHYFPPTVETMRAKDKILKQINVFGYNPAYLGYTLEQVREKHPDGIDARSLAWIYKRLLECLGFSHQCGWVHNATLPTHVLVFPSTHGINLVDWKTASQSGPLSLISAKYREWYPAEVKNKEATGPATDIYLATKCMVYLAGGNPVTGTIPPSIPRQMAGYFRSAMMERASMRPQDAWQFHEEFSAMLVELYGKPKWHELVMP
jgi:hypothetical protein